MAIMGKDHIFKMLSNEVQKQKPGAPKASAKRKQGAPEDEEAEVDEHSKPTSAGKAKAAPKTRVTKKAKQA